METAQQRSPATRRSQASMLKFPRTVRIQKDSPSLFSSQGCLCNGRSTRMFNVRGVTVLWRC